VKEVVVVEVKESEVEKDAAAAAGTSRHWCRSFRTSESRKLGTKVARVGPDFLLGSFDWTCPPPPDVYTCSKLSSLVEKIAAKEGERQQRSRKHAWKRWLTEQGGQGSADSGKMVPRRGAVADSEFSEDHER
jgi:hypothetical protein